MKCFTEAFQRLHILAAPKLVISDPFFEARGLDNFFAECTLERRVFVLFPIMHERIVRKVAYTVYKKTIVLVEYWALIPSFRQPELHF